MSAKIVKLTALNVEALTLMAPGHTSLLETTKTTATFVGLTAYEALGIVQRMQETAGERYGKVGGPYASLSAVRRKLLTLAETEQAEAQARSDARAESDAANDPLMVLLNDDRHTRSQAQAAADAKLDALLVPIAAIQTAEIDAEFAALRDLEDQLTSVRAARKVIPASVSTLGQRVTAALSDAQVTSALGRLAEQAAAGTMAAQAFRMARPSRVAGRLVAASKSGQRRPKRSKRRG
jgi:hypothetical protein